MQYVMQHILAMQRFFALTLVLVTASFGLMGCGNKGPLYLPPEAVQEVSSAPSTSNEKEESSEPEETETTINTTTETE